MKVLVVEDEIPAQEELIRIIKKHFPDIDIADTAKSVKESVAWLRHNDADLIFMDIQLSDGCCFDIFNIIEVKTPVIFTTAYDQYALKAFKTNSVDYLLKPIDEAELIAAVNKLDYRYSRITNLIQNFVQPSDRYKTRISVKSGNTYNVLPIDKVSHFISEEGLTFAISDSGTRHLINYTIESIEPSLNPPMFFKATRGCIISIGSIAKVSKYFNNRLKVSLKHNASMDLMISRARVQDFFKWLDG